VHDNLAVDFFFLLLSGFAIYLNYCERIVGRMHDRKKQLPIQLTFT
jgi:hypothetical protein